jgi:hypothetical protein
MWAVDKSLLMVVPIEVFEATVYVEVIAYPLPRTWDSRQAALPGSKALPTWVLEYGYQH